MSFFSMLKETIAFMRDLFKGRIGHNSEYEIAPDMDENWSGSLDEDPYRTDDSDEVTEPKIWYSLELLDDFRKTVGSLPPETGGMIACSMDQNYIDTRRFEKNLGIRVPRILTMWRKWKLSIMNGKTWVSRRWALCIRILLHTDSPLMMILLLHML